ncbi:MAG: alpha-galactosidase [Erythrobacter sp.]
MAEWTRLDGHSCTLVFALARGAGLRLVYLGPRLPAHEDLAALAHAAGCVRHESQPDIPPEPGLFPEAKHGLATSAAIRLRQGGRSLPTDLTLADWQAEGCALSVILSDDDAGIEARLIWRIAAGDIVECRTILTNRSNEPVELEHCASLALPIPHGFTDLTSYSGRWASEMHEARRPIRPDGLVRQSRGGKPGFDGGNWAVLHAGAQVLGAHLAWSGDFDTRIECDSSGASDGRSVLQMAARWDRGEIILAPGEEFATPGAIFALAPDRSALAQQFHAFLRAEILPGRGAWGERRVHCNSWEAAGFDLSEARLMQLASDAASLGVERFVLDDGWFGRRRDDTTSLGDWGVSPQVFPGGLGALIAHVQSLGMDFGLWVEPEMISPQSELYAAHPDWCLHLAGRERRTMRQQLMLDLTRPEASDHVFSQLDALLRAHPIAYLKWDHNRTMFPASGASGPVRYRQTAALYALLDRLRAAHPSVEIESCSSGGGRIDYGILARTARVWPSDNNDALERLRIMRAWSQFVPLEVLGNHVGPAPNPITGRRIAMDFCAKVAMFGHMGVEADPASMNDKERATLAAHIALYKAWRSVLHAGALHRLAHPDPGVTAMMVTHGDKAIALVAQTAFSSVFDAAPLRLAGLDPEALYRVTLPEPWPKKARHYLAHPDLLRTGLTLSGAALMSHGLALPLTHPETAWLIALERLPQ